MLSRRLLRILSCRSVWGKEPEAVGYRGSLSLLRVPAGLLRAGACFADRASGGQHIKGGQLFFQGCLYLSGDFFVEAFGGQTVLLVPGIFHLRHRGEQEKLLIFFTLGDVLLYASAVGGAGPGMAVALTVGFADKPDFVRKGNFFYISEAVFADGIL